MAVLEPPSSQGGNDGGENNLLKLHQTFKLEVLKQQVKLATKEQLEAMVLDLIKQQMMRENLLAQMLKGGMY